MIIWSIYSILRQSFYSSKFFFYLPFIHIYKDTHTHIYVSINLSIPLRKKRKKASILSPSYGKTEEIWINCYKNLRWNLLPRDSNSANDGNIKVITCIFHGLLLTLISDKSSFSVRVSYTSENNLIKQILEEGSEICSRIRFISLNWNIW